MRGKSSRTVMLNVWGSRGRSNRALSALASASGSAGGACELAKDRDGFLEFTRPLVTGTDAYVVPETASRRKDRSGEDRNASGQSGSIELHRIEPRHFHPQRVPARRPTHACAGWKRCTHCVIHLFRLPGERATQPPEMPIVQASAHELRDYHLA